MSIHKELALEDGICAHLAAQGWLYEANAAARYDRASALFPDDLLAWVEATQPEPDPKVSDMPLKNAALPAVTVSVAPLMVPITVRVPRAAIVVPVATPEPWMASPAARGPVGAFVTVRVVPTMMPLNMATPVPAGQ